MRRFAGRLTVIFAAFGTFGFNVPAVLGDDQCPGPRDQSIRPKIVGGRAAELEHWPGQVTLRITNPDLKQSAYLCGGTLISQDWVLSAAHCFKEGRTDFFEKDTAGRFHTTMEDWQFDDEPLNFRGTAFLEVVLGTANLNQVSDSNVREVENIVPHPDYTQASRSGHDIALVKLKSPFTGELARVSTTLATDPITPPGTVVMVAGFGDQKWRAPLKRYGTEPGPVFAAGSETLREVDLPTISAETCKSRFRTANIGSGQICAGHKQGLKDSCQGDSGGPLVAFDKQGCPYQVGIVSFGPPCAEKPAYGVYTRVSAYSGWINSFVPALVSVGPGDAVDVRSVATRVGLVDTALDELKQLLQGATGEVKVKLRRLNPDDTTTDLNPEDAEVVVRLGERFLMNVESDVNGRLILVDIDANGKVTQIFPNRFVRSDDIGQIETGQAVDVPGEAYGFDWFRAQEPSGKSRVLALVVSEEFAAENDHVVVEWTSRGLTPEQAPTEYLANLIDQIGLTLQKENALTDRGLAPGRAQGDWALKVVEYMIEN